jgi:hypothetical protein
MVNPVTTPNRGGRPTVGVLLGGGIRVPPDTAAALAQYTATRGISRAQATRDLLAHALDCPTEDMAALLSRWLTLADDVRALGGVGDQALENETRAVLHRPR